MFHPILSRCPDDLLNGVGVIMMMRPTTSMFTTYVKRALNFRCVQTLLTQISGMRDF